jgi:hypothetical protein
VDGNLYDVQFLDGSCIDLYTGCDEASNFTFQTEASATLASQALLDQVLLDGVDGQFDSFTELTNGCPSPGHCLVLTIYPVINPLGQSIPIWLTVNQSLTEPDYTTINGIGPLGVISDIQISTSGDPRAVYAVWSPVPEPSTALLLSLGLTGLAGKGRRRNRS